MRSLSNSFHRCFDGALQPGEEKKNKITAAFPDFPVNIGSIGVLAVILFFFSSPGYAKAETPSPWFHLASISRPGRLVPSVGATDEVQEIVTTQSPKEEFFGFKPVEKQTYFVLRVDGVDLGPGHEGTPGHAGFRFTGEFATKELAEAFPAEVTLLSAENLQKALEESKAYGASNVTVQEKSEAAGGGPLPPGDKRYLIASVGEKADQVVAAVETTPVAGGTATSTVLTESKPTKDHMAATVINLGDGTTSSEGAPVTLRDHLPPNVTAISAEENNGGDKRGPLSCVVPSPHEVLCTLAKGDFESPEHPTETGTMPPYSSFEIVIYVDVAPGATSGEVDELVASGGGAPAASLKHEISVAAEAEEATPYGIETYEQSFEEPSGSPTTQAGKHPFQFTTTLNLEQEADAQPVSPTKDLTFTMPPGFVGDPQAYPRCPIGQFLSAECPLNTILGMAVVSYAEEHNGVHTAEASIYNLEPSEGEPARFGFRPDGVPVLLDTSVRTGADYGVTVHVENVPQTIGFLANTVTFWGVPGSPLHDNVRGVECQDETYDLEHSVPCQRLEERNPTPFLSMPTSCTGPLPDTLEADSWNEPLSILSYPSEPRQSPQQGKMPALDGCGRLPFAAEVRASVDEGTASTPSGLKVDIHVPQAEALNPKGLAPAILRNITVALPAAVHLNPSSADGLQACSADPGALSGRQLGSPGDEIGFTGSAEGTLRFTPELPESFAAKGAAEDHELPESEATLQPGGNFCSNASKIGEVTIKTPLLPKPLTGFVYLAAQESNPFGSLLAMYLVAEDPESGVLVKLAGEVQLCKGAGEIVDGFTCEELGQIVTTFQNNPQLPFEDAELHFFGGERAPLATPSRCGAYTTNASFEPWTNTATIHEDLHASSTFEITSGPNHTACPGTSLPFKPSLTGGALNVNAGAFSPFTATFSRQSGEQNMQSIEVHLPPGLSGILAGVELCPEPQANLGECGANSLIGETTVSVGVGGEPYTVSGGKFYLTGPYNGNGSCNTPGINGCAPFGITFTVPAKAGPFDLANTQHNKPPCDCVLVRGKIEINPFTSALTITSNPAGTQNSIPTELEGIPLEIQHVNAITTRNSFQFNPTNCNKMEVTGTIHSSEGAADTIGVPFQVTNCAALKFNPSIAFSTNGKTSKSNGADLITKVTYPQGPQGTYANLSYVKVELPKALPSRLTTLQKACTDAQFEANPAACPAASKIGYATVHTPLLPVPLTGPAIFVSHGGEAFPSLTMVLQGYGVTIDLVGTTFISKSGITSTTFKTVPDQPFSSFELTLPQGPFSALAANGNLCTEQSSLKLPVEFLSQAGGAPLKQDPSVTVTGCKPQITVVSHKVKGRTTTIQVKVPSAGRLTASARGLVASGGGKGSGGASSKATKTTSSASGATLTVKLQLSSKEQAFLAKHHGRKLEAKIHLTFTQKKGPKLKATTTVDIG
jgi:hypothetical protein